MYILFVEDQAPIANLMNVDVHHLPVTLEGDAPHPPIRSVPSVGCALEA